MERFSAMLKSEGIEVHTFPYDESVDDRVGYATRIAEVLGLASYPNGAMARALGATSSDAMTEARTEGTRKAGVGGSERDSRKVEHAKKFSYLTQLPPAAVQRCIDAVRPHTPPDLFDEYYSAHQH